MYDDLDFKHPEVVQHLRLGGLGLLRQLVFVAFAHSAVKHIDSLLQRRTLSGPNRTLLRQMVSMCLR